APYGLNVWVQRRHSGAWAKLGGAVNPSAAGVANSTTKTSSVGIASDGTAPWVVWTEVTAANARSQVLVSQWTGAAWSQVGSSLNSSVDGYADDASITYVGGQAYVAWVERGSTGSGSNAYGDLTSKVYVKTY